MLPWVVFHFLSVWLWVEDCADSQGCEPRVLGTDVYSGQDMLIVFVFVFVFAQIHCFLYWLYFFFKSTEFSGNVWHVPLKESFTKVPFLQCFQNSSKMQFEGNPSFFEYFVLRRIANKVHIIWIIWSRVNSGHISCEVLLMSGVIRNY